MTLLGRDFLRELDFTREELLGLLDLGALLKAERRAGTESQRLGGKRIALLFEKTSTRTRISFEVAAAEQGAATTYLDPQSSQLGHKESAADTARVLSRLFDAIEYRGSSQAIVNTLAEFADVPVYNGLTDDWHPTQMLADFLTMRECAGQDFTEISYAYLGDARNNMGNSLLVTGAILGCDVRIVAPKALWPDESVQAAARDRASGSGGRILLTENPDEGLAGVNAVHTDVWVSMGEPADVWAERIALLRPYRVDTAMMKRSGRDDTVFMHCLPAFHDVQTAVGQKVAAEFGLTGGVEVTHEVFESPASVVFDQAENRMHTIKAVLVATLVSA
jgi:ornithine carbamoyltransferase